MKCSQIKIFNFLFDIRCKILKLFFKDYAFFSLTPRKFIISQFSRRTALSLTGGAIAIGLYKYYPGHGILKQNNCYSYGPIAEY